MDLATTKAALKAAETMLEAQSFAELTRHETPHGPLRVLVTNRLRRRCKKGRVWMSVPMLTALKNAAYGFDPKASRSRGGSDGVFAIDRHFKPANAMMKKLFDNFLDKPDPLLSELSAELGTPAERWTPVRIVSHHMRLLGILDQASMSTLVLVDFDADKH